MAKTFSFTRIERELAPEFRKKVNEAETILDLKNLYAQTGFNLLQKALSPEMVPSAQDIVFSPDAPEFFVLRSSLRKNREIDELLQNSDLLKVMGRFAYSVNRRYLHLRKHLHKTNLKIRK